jgi:uncharacterized membrane protein YkoI
MRMKPLIFAALLSAALFAAETKVRLEDTPAAVQKTIRAESQGATVVGITSETENGKKQYELETKVNGKGRDVTIAPDGKVLSVEEEVPLASVPQGARSMLERRAAGGQIEKVEKVTEGGKVEYEAAIRRNGKSSEVRVSPSGVVEK